ncbi:MAG: TonB-dependent siderophore receptor [Microcoleus sp. SIO2G3]|nr:TonB-dependent siderophore receptor [Microcoleus sp. SIO2G3]
MPQLHELEQPATTVTNWIAQIKASLVQITGVRVEETETGLQVILETAEGGLSVPETRIVDNALIADISNVTIAEEFSQAEPIEGIALVSVTSLPGDRVRIAITGTDAPPVAEVTAEAQELVVAVTLGDADTVAEDDAIQVVVTGEQDEGYNPSSATTATRTDTPLRDIPQSIQVIPQPVIEDQNALRLGEALRNASGVVTTTGRAQEGDGIYIRGFGGPFNSSFRRNGLRDQNGPFVITDPANIDRIEILRGPASVLFGEGNPGGTVNIVTEQPLSEPFYEIEATVGNYDFYRGAIDISGPLNESRTILYRLNAAAQTSGSFIDFFDEERYFIGPSLALRLGDRTQLTLEAEYQNTISPGYFGLPAFGTALDNPNGELPLDLFTGEPDESQNDIRIYRLGYNLEHQFSDNWEIRNAFQLTDRDNDGLQIGLTGVRDDNRTFDRFYFRNLEPFSVRTYALDTYVSGEFSTGSIQHQLVFGFDLSRAESRLNGIFGNAGPLDLFDPDYGQPLEAGDPNRSLQTNDALGIYIQDQIDLTDNLIVLLGGRFDIVSQTREDYVANSETFQQDEAFSPRLGIVYQPIEPISIYASYSRSFQQVVGDLLDDSLFEPERGTQYELGIKADVTDRLSATLALFDLTRTNVLTSDPRDPIFSIQSGRQRSRGVELDVAGEILPGWNIIAGYAYTDARVVEDNTFEEGNRLDNVPEHSFNFWTTYEIQEGDLRGLGFGLGFFFIGDREGDLSNTFELDSYLRTDAAIYYRRDRFSAALNFKNLFDVDYFSNALNQFRLYPGEPFTVQATISWQF